MYQLLILNKESHLIPYSQVKETFLFSDEEKAL